MSKLSLLAVLCGVLQWRSEAQEFLLGRSVAESSSMYRDRRKKKLSVLEKKLFVVMPFGS